MNIDSSKNSVVKDDLLQLRHKLKENLDNWMPNHPALVAKELSIFDTMRSRRDFLKSTSLAALLALVNHGCGNSNGSTPSQISGLDNSVSEQDKQSVDKASKLLVDSDVMDALRPYDILSPRGSSDGLHVRSEAILESFNPHIITVDSKNSFEESGFNPLNRNYGIPEFVQLHKKDDVDYALAIYEKSNIGHHGLKEQSLKLNDSSAKGFNDVVAVNGSFHNRVESGVAYCQKMLLVSNLEIQKNVALMLYYQTSSNLVLEPSVEYIEDFSWKFIDLIKAFKESETTLSFTDYNVVDIASFTDGHNHGLLYGTIQFDLLYSYGFVASFNAISDDAPKITFFAPEFLSKQSTFISDLQKSFDDTDVQSDTAFSDFALFANQKFIPFAQMVDENSNTTSEVLFSFLTLQSSEDDEVYAEDDGSYDLSDYSDSSSSMSRHYLLGVDVALGGVQYPFKAYAPSASMVLQEDEETFIVNFDSTSIPSIDIVNEVYNVDKTSDNSRATLAFSNSFVRSMKRSATSLELVVATSYYDTSDVGITQHAITIKIDKNASEFSAFSLDSIASLHSSFDASEHDSKSYKEYWFNEAKGSGNNYDSLADAISADNGYFDFYTTQTHQGLLRSYFIIRLKSDDAKSMNSFLLTFNEQGENSTPSGDKVYDYQSHQNLVDSITNAALKHYPPLPIAINPTKLHRWHNIAQDGEVLFSAQRLYAKDEAKKSLNNNSSTSLLSYNHAVNDSLEGIWSSFEQEKQTQESTLYQVTNHQVYLHVNNVYDFPAPLDDKTYVELRFSKSVIVKDLSDTNNPITYHVGRLSSIFLQTDSSGVISLEIDSGSTKEDKMKGVNMLYRFLDTKDVNTEENSPIAVVAANDTTEFKSCNISFKLYDRLSNDGMSSHQEGASSQTKLAKDSFDAHMKAEYKDTLPDFGDAYAKLHTNAKPDNTTVSRSMRSVDTQSVDALVFVASFNASPLQRGLFSDVVSWGKKAIHTISHGLSRAEQLAKELAEKIKKSVDKLVADVKSITANISASLSDAIVQIAQAFKKVLDIVISIAELIWDFIKALFDTNAIWTMAQELKGLFSDQLTSTLNANAFSILKENMSNITDSVDDAIKSVKSNLDSTIESTMKQGLNAKHKESQASRRDRAQHYAKANYFVHQQARVSHSKSNKKVAQQSAECSSSATATEQVLCVATQSVENAMQEANTLIKDSFSAIKELAQGSDKDLSKLAHDVSNLLLTDMQSVSKGIISMPLKFFDASEELQSVDEVLEGDIKAAYDALSLLLFLETGRFKNYEDVVYFTLAGALNLMYVTMKEVLPSKESFNIRDYIKDGDFRKDVASLATSSKSKARVLDTTRERILFTTTTIDAFVVISSLGIDFQAEEGDILAAKTQMYAQLLRAALLTPRFILDVHEDKSMDAVSDVLRFSGYIANFLRFRAILNGNNAFAFTMVYVFINVLSKIMDLILAFTSEASDAHKSERIVKESINNIDALLTIFLAVVKLEEDPIDVSIAKAADILFQGVSVSLSLTIVSTNAPQRI